MLDMIASFSVENVRSFRERTTLSFIPTAEKELRDEYTREVRPGVRLLKLGLVYGANASGKTNILQALELFCRLMTSAPRERTASTGITPFLLDAESRGNPSCLEMDFYLGGEKYNLSVRLDSERIYQERLVVYPTTQPAVLYERTYLPAKDMADIRFGAKLGLTSAERSVLAGNTLVNATVLATLGRVNIQITRLNRVFVFLGKAIFEFPQRTPPAFSYAKMALQGGTASEVKAFLLQWLRKADINVEDVLLKKGKGLILEDDVMRSITASLPLPAEEVARLLTGEGEPEMRFLHRTRGGVYELSAGDESTGTLQLLDLGTVLYAMLKGEPFVALDEVEKSLHYELLLFFLKAFLLNSKGSAQLLVATHDLNLLDEDFIRRDAVWFAEKDGEGASHLSRLSSYGLHRNVSPYRAYRLGKLADLPFTGSIYFDRAE